MKRAALLFGLLFLATSSARQAPAGEEDSVLRAGDRVRLYAQPLGSDWVVGTFEGFRGDTIDISTTEASVGVPKLYVDAMERSRGKKSHAIKGLVFGFLGFGAAAAIIAYAGDGPPGVYTMSQEGWAALNGVAYAIPGAAIGVLVGSLLRTESWEEVPVRDISGREAVPGLKESTD